MTVSKILVAHDFSEPANRALRFAATLASATGAGLELVYVLPDVYDGRADIELTLPAMAPGQGERYLKFLEEELRRVVETITPELAAKASYHVQRGDAVKHIEALAAERKADVICVGATGKNAVSRALLGSISQLLLRTSAIPVLVVP